MAEASLDVQPAHLHIVQSILKKHLPTAVVWAFGSRTTGKAKPYSDLDLCINAGQPLDLAVLAALEEDFSESDLPWRVDVVDWAITGDAFRKVIEQHRLVVQIG